jgi:predicted dehydrogenase
MRCNPPRRCYGFARSTRHPIKPMPNPLFPVSRPAPGTSRREFLRRAAASSAAIAFPAVLPACAIGRGGRPAPSGRIQVGVIGTGNQGFNDIRSMITDERVQIVAVCDVNRESTGYWNGAVGGREPGRRLVEEYYTQRAAGGSYRGCAAYGDFRELLARDDLDAVMIATPDHWHALLTVEACRRGKDVYCQKPLSLTVAEGRAMADAVKRHRRVLQCGSQQRSEANFRRACEFVRNGRIGRLHTVKCGLPGGHSDYGRTGHRKAPEPVPEGFDYRMWLGPAPDAPYCPARTHVNFRWILDYSGGQVTDWGGHHPDIAQWAKGTFPPSTELWNTATEFWFECEYESGVRLIISNQFEGGVTFEGTEGSIWVTRGNQRTNPESLWESQIGPQEIQLYRSTHHFRNFVDCVYSREEPAAPAEVAHRSITLAHLGNIAMRLGRDLKWDPVRERILDDAEAASMLSRPYHHGWQLG